MSVKPEIFLDTASTCSVKNLSPRKDLHRCFVKSLDIFQGY